MQQLNTISAASFALGIPVRTLISWEARGAVGPWQRDTSGRRILSQDDLAQLRTYAEGRRRAQGPELREQATTDPEDRA